MEQLLRRFVVLFLALLSLAACTTNQLHLAGYTSAAELKRMSTGPRDYRVTKITGVDLCESCSESDNIVWHAAFHPLEGTFPIPIKDWDGFIRAAIEGSATNESRARPVQIAIDQIFLKTWEPEYRACRVKLRVAIGQRWLEGTSDVKLEGDMHLRDGDRVELRPEGLDVIRLAITGAFLDAVQSQR